MSAAERRAGYIAGLRRMAELLERHADLPLPDEGTETPVSISVLGTDAAARMDAIRQMLGIPMSSNQPTGSGFDRDFVELSGDLEGLRVAIWGPRPRVHQRGGSQVTR